ncbi:MAG: DUF1972 domain-containing protein [Desulfobulbaceae bacterium]|nr:DUF1972 domain-containing protein [Desulfobulbaceae bacterium]
MQIAILGTRGIPAQHGGFETFAEHFALYLVDKGWEVSFYCQDDGNGDIFEDDWRGVHRIHIPVTQAGAKGTVIFDWKSTLHATGGKRPVLTLGYNTAIFCILYRFHGIYNIINMDGIEWRRAKWSFLERVWLYMNEKLGAWLGNHLIADHPEIKKHLIQFVREQKVTVIPYAADILDSADEGLLSPYGQQKNRYAIIIARPEPENSIYEVVIAFSRKTRNMHLAVLGNFNPETNEYHKKVIEAAGSEVKFLGAIYDKPVVHSLRFFARLYIHGHTVGGTNPSLVEALGARSPVLANDNKFNRWVAGEKARYFSTEDDCARELDNILDDEELISKMKNFSHQQISTHFTWDKVHRAYEQLLIEAMQNPR